MSVGIEGIVEMQILSHNFGGRAIYQIPADDFKTNSFLRIQ